jgi:hypothetical protein
MHIEARFKVIYFLSITFGFVLSATAIAQTFSPYTPAQIQEFNNQPIAPIETPAGAVYLESPPVPVKSKTPFDSRYVKNPDGEEQAEAQGEESAAPFEPISPTFTF